MIQPDWKQFEKAVATFLSALDPSARVVHNIELSDTDTGLQRQRDIWIETKVLNHFPLTIYVSCKHKSRRLSQQDMDAVVGELRSSGAVLGVVYSFNGFTVPALLKAKKLGIVCCRLFQGRAPEIPQALVIPSYLSMPTIRFGIDGDPRQTAGFSTYDELFEFEEGGAKLIDSIVQLYRRVEKESTESIISTGKFPPECPGYSLTFENTDTVSSFRINVLLEWKVFQGNTEYYLLNGSYCISSGQFLGAQSFPSIDTQGPTPGAGWTQIEADAPINSPYLHVAMYGPDYKASILKEYCGKSL